MINFFCINTFGQRFYIEGNAGLSPSNYQDPYYNFPIDNTLMQVGDSYNVSAAIGVDICRFHFANIKNTQFQNGGLAVELEYSHIASTSTTIKTNFIYGNLESYGKLNFDRKRYIPSIKFSFGDANQNKIIYGKIGVIIGMKGLVGSDLILGSPGYTGPPPHNTWEELYSENIFQDNYSYGFSIVFGIEKKIDKHIYFFYELGFCDEFWSPSNAEAVNIIGGPPSYSIGQTETEFSGKGSTMGFGSYQQNTPYQAPKYSFALFTVNFNIGFKLSFGKIKTDSK